MKTFSTYAFLLSILAVSCTSDKTEESQNKSTDQKQEIESEVVKDFSSLLVGEWSNLTLDLIIKSNPDSVVKVAEGEWEKVLKIKPIRTIYNADGTYQSIYTSLEGEPLGSVTGIWSLVGDELTMEERGAENKYKLEINGNIVTFTGELDWNEDGILDHYSGTQIKSETQDKILP